MKKNFNSILHFQGNRKIQHHRTQTDLVGTVCQTLIHDLSYISGSCWRHVTILPHFREVWHADGEKVAKITAISTLKTDLCCHPNQRCLAANGGGAVYLGTFCEGLCVIERSCRKSRGTQRKDSSIGPAREALTQKSMENKRKHQGVSVNWQGIPCISLEFRETEFSLFLVRKQSCIKAIWNFHGTFSLKLNRVWSLVNRLVEKVVTALKMKV